MKKTTLLLTFLIISVNSFADRIRFTTDDGAKIYVNDNYVGTGAFTYKIGYNETIKVKFEKPGFITQYRSYTKDRRNNPPSNENINLEIDEAYQSSYTTDIANRDIDIKTNLDESSAWKQISRIIASTFEVIETSDNTTGYLRSAWIVKNFNSGTVRTRIILKTVSSSPLSYKVKIVSEIAPSGASSREDEMFKPWDRVLRAFENTIPDLQTRMSK